MNTINPQQLPQIRWQNQNVITTELLAQCYGTETARIRQSYSRNESRFEEGKHFFKVEGDDLKNLRVSFSDSQSDLQPDEIESQISSKTRSLILWTDKGAARHSKILDTDKAWDVFDQLEESYFHPERKANAPHPLLTPITTPLTLAQFNERQKALDAAQQALHQAQIIVTAADLLPKPANRRKTKAITPRKWTPEEVSALHEMRAKGHTFPQIARQLGRTEHSVANHYQRDLAKGGVQ